MVKLPGLKSTLVVEVDGYGNYCIHGVAVHVVIACLHREVDHHWVLIVPSFDQPRHHAAQVVQVLDNVTVYLCYQKAEVARVLG